MQITSMADRLGNRTKKIAQLHSQRLVNANLEFAEHLTRTGSSINLSDVTKSDEANVALTPLSITQAWYEYVVDSCQRCILFADTLRQRGDNYIEHNRAGMPPLLHFDYETIIDGRRLSRPVNYALLRIIGKDGSRGNDKRRPYIIIDPRAGHGPGIGGFKDDSQVGVALREEHPVYFVMFYPEPVRGQTLLDICQAEELFVKEVCKRHPKSSKPALVGNCQGGWAAMMLAASQAENTGVVVINGAPMSYWGGAWNEDQVGNPMRYSGGLLGGSWPASFTADLGGGLFDGAWLVMNFENLNPANTLWNKYYHLYRNIDNSEVGRFLDFERWWSGFYLLDKNEMDWITQNLFVGNKLWGGGTDSQAKQFDLREIKSPIILFASKGDNITPTQQAFNWVADVYGSTEEIKANGQVIVGLVHEDIGHLGIFVSGKVARKEHSKIVSVLKHIESLPPGLYAMEIVEGAGSNETESDVLFHEWTLEEAKEGLNLYQRRDERMFETVAKISEYNQQAYELFVQPWMQLVCNEFVGEALRVLHPLRLQRSLFSSANTFTYWLSPVAERVKLNRQPVEDNLFRHIENTVSESIVSCLDLYRDLRDASVETLFFTLYGGTAIVDFSARDKIERAAQSEKQQKIIEDALSKLHSGGYCAAVSRIALMLQDKDVPISLEELKLKKDLLKTYKSLLPDVSEQERRKIRGIQEVILANAPENALNSLAMLLDNPKDKNKFLSLLDMLESDRRLKQFPLSVTQQETIKSIRQQLIVH
jgi:pimeloyl-ACP methyl ester carboxylesterase